MPKTSDQATPSPAMDEEITTSDASDLDEPWTVDEAEDELQRNIRDCSLQRSTRLNGLN